MHTIASGNWLEDDNKVEDYKKSIINKLIKDEPCICRGCSFLVKSFWENTPKLMRISIGGGWKGEACNAKCIYCGAQKKGFKGKHDLMMYWSLCPM